MRDTEAAATIGVSARHIAIYLMLMMLMHNLIAAIMDRENMGVLFVCVRAFAFAADKHVFVFYKRVSCLSSHASGVCYVLRLDG